MRLYLFSFLFLIAAQLQATAPFVISVTPEWEDTPHKYEVFPGKTVEILRFAGADYAPKHPTLPSFGEVFPVSAAGRLEVVLKNAEYESVSKQAHEDDIFIKEQIEIDAQIGLARGQALGSVEFIPLRRDAVSGQLERLVSGELHIRHIPVSNAVPKNAPTNTIISVLSSGDIYKIAVSESGVYKIDADFLENELNVNLSNIDPSRIQLFGNGGQALSEIVGDFRYDDVYENAIFVSGQNDGNFDSDDFIVFYAAGPHPARYDANNDILRGTKNLYSDESYYFLKINGENGKRISSQASTPGATYSTDSYDALIHFEEELVNLLDYFSTHPSGREWYGDQFKFLTDKEYDFKFNNLLTNEPVQIRSRLAGRSVNDGTHRFEIKYNGATVSTANMGNVGGGATSTFAAIRNTEGTINATSDDITLQLEYTRPTGGEGWLDYFELQARCGLIYEGNPLIFRDLQSTSHSTTNFNISNANNNIQIWNITNPLDPTAQDYNLSGNQATFGTNTENLQTHIIFEPANLVKPNFIEKINPQNLHGITTSPELLVLYSPELESAVTRFVNHRSEHSNISVQAVPIYQIYNEFGSGASDVTAIRDFVKMLYERSTPTNSLKYLLMFGDGSFDIKNNNGISDFINLAPVYETLQSVSPIQSYPADDYFVLLDDTEGNISAGYMDVAVGRFPVKNLLEADAAVDKIIRYDTDPKSLGDWRNNLLFNADDQDNNLHFRDADTVASRVARAYEELNVNKIYFDAYQQVSTPGGNRYPDATTAINNSVFKGNLIMNYTGHGGSNGWAQEFVLGTDDFTTWQNKHKLPLMVTATCEFAPYDDPNNVTAGEQLFLSPNSGAIALFTTVRAVYANANYRLSRAVFETIFEPVNGQVPPIGEILRNSKNTSGASAENSRKFALLGDPSMSLAIPQFDVMTTQINGAPISETDTVSALEEVTVKGYIADENGAVLSDFTGTLYPTVYDKVQIITTLGNDDDSYPAQFRLQRNVIFKGLASVVNGEFQFSFVVPSDIDFSFGEGKISYYAHDGVSRDASGFYDKLIIGGSSDGITDDQPPVVEVYMNDEEFVFGGITSSEPTLLVKLSDNLGINTAGAGIGHDITGNLDENTQKTYILNDFYQSEIDNPRKGEVRYPLADIAEGRHNIKVKAWDVSNNSAEGYTEFVVARRAEIALAQVLNYPNPFTTYTEFQFEHNFAGQPLDVMVQIFTTSGQLVKTIHENVQPEGYRVRGIEWDGTDDFGERIGKGVYVYRVTVQTETGSEAISTESEFEKLVILK